MRGRGSHVFSIYYSRSAVHMGMSGQFYMIHGAAGYFSFLFVGDPINFSL